jgi:cytosine/adenosine deaminase-related metal-dependent hydrolase
VHATHLTPGDIALLADSLACFCPTTERDLADGIGPARALHDAGARLCLGSDQHAVIDPFEELRGLEMNERLASGARGRFTPPELVTAATANGYASLGWNGGRLEVGQLCDFVTIDDSSVRTAGALPDQLPLAATASDVVNVIVGGRLVVTNRRHSIGDVGAALQTAIERIP